MFFKVLFLKRVIRSRHYYVGFSKKHKNDVNATSPANLLRNFIMKEERRPEVNMTRGMMAM